MTFSRETYKHGLRCMECDHRFEEGEAISRNLVGISEETFVTETVCALCPIEAALTV